MVRFSLTCDLEQLRLATEEIAEFARREDLVQQTQSLVELAIEELFVNFVNYGSNPAGLFSVEIEANGDQVVIEVRDNGDPYDLTQTEAVNVDAPLNDRQPGGLGLHLTRNISQQVEYRREDGWNVTRLQIHRKQ